jgi:hypothetical protein
MGCALNAESMVTVATLESHENPSVSLSAMATGAGASGFGQSSLPLLLLDRILLVLLNSGQVRLELRWI